MSFVEEVRRNKNDWELAQIDALWAILSDPRKKFQQWDIDDFFLTGQQEISDLIKSVEKLGYPTKAHLALDFGCGVGRLTKALAGYFDRCIGVDISEEMIARARELNKNLTTCEFILNAPDRLEQFHENTFDLIYTSIVLQYVGGKEAILRYVKEFVRVLKPNGILAMQVPASVPWYRLVQPRRRIYQLLRGIRLHKAMLYNRLGLNPMRMNFVPEQHMVQFLDGLKASTLMVQSDRMAGPGIESRRYFVTKAKS